ncbi:hypothetical protein CJ030_MR3G024003 [Morella rubra]|uniref:Uncharacterized protein n=1 Tax=Morella rubra TaxID=262757 RepID=A0A6A1W6D4_9ROSI|nr:hypothetical protein CJ030_MR3G024003 [Morella rubra]
MLLTPRVRSPDPSLLPPAGDASLSLSLCLSSFEPPLLSAPASLPPLSLFLSHSTQSRWPVSLFGSLTPLVLVSLCCGAVSLRPGLSLGLFLFSLQEQRQYQDVANNNHVSPAIHRSSHASRKTSADNADDAESAGADGADEGGRWRGLNL